MKLLIYKGTKENRKMVLILGFLIFLLLVVLFATNVLEPRRSLVGMILFNLLFFIYLFVTPYVMIKNNFLYFNFSRLNLNKVKSAKIKWNDLFLKTEKGEMVIPLEKLSEKSKNSLLNAVHSFPQIQWVED